MKLFCRKNYRVKLLPLISVYGLLESDIFRKYAIKIDMFLEIWGSKNCSPRDSILGAQLDLWHKVCFSLSWWDFKMRTGEPGTERTISAPALSHYPANLHDATCGFYPFKRFLCLLLGAGTLLLGLDSSHPSHSPMELHKGKLSGRHLLASPVPALVLDGDMG